MGSGLTLFHRSLSSIEAMAQSRSRSPYRLARLPFPTFLEKVMEGCWLMAVVAIPVLFHLHAETIFEAEKAALLRSLALPLAGALGLWLLLQRRLAWRRVRQLASSSLGVAAGLTLASYLLSTLFSVDVHESIWGSYPRRQGLLSFGAYLAVFLGVSLTLRSPAQLRLLLAAMVMTSVAAALYGISQTLGLDPLPWGWSTRTRPAGAAGNPVFLGAFLVMVMPLTLALGGWWVVVKGRGLGFLGKWGPGLGYAFLFLLQLSALLLTRSRGPLLGLAVGMVFFGLLALRWAPRRWVMAGLGSGAVLTLVLGLAVLPGGPLERLQDTPPGRWLYLDRFSEAFDTGSGTAAVRLLIWEGMADLVAESPRRLLTGSGPETLLLSFYRHYRPELAVLETGLTAADRAHNRTYDDLATRGLPGLVADLLLVGGLLAASLAGMGVLGRWRVGGRRLLPLLVMGGCLMGGGAAMALGTPAFLGPFLPLGAVAGLLLYLLLDLLRPAERPVEAPEWKTVVLLALGAGVLAHFVETQVGIQTIGTRLYLWTMAGAVVALTLPGFARGGKETAAPSQGSWGLMTAFGLASASFGFLALADVAADAALVLGILVSGVWATAVVLYGTLEEGKPGSLFVLSVVAFLVFAGVQLLWTHWTGLAGETGTISTEVLLVRAGRLSNTLVFFVGLLYLAAGVFGYMAVPSLRRFAWGPLLLLSPLILLPLAWRVPLAPSRTDVFMQLGKRYEERGSLPTAVELFETASRLQCGQPEPFMHLARVNLLMAREAEAESQRRGEALDRAVEAAGRAAGLRQADPRMLTILAGMETEAGLLSADAEVARERFLLADEVFELAVAAGPAVPDTWVTWGRSLANRGETRRALQVLDRARELAPDYLPGIRLRGEAHLALGDWAGAREAFRRAVQLDPGDAASWRGLGTAYARLDARAESVEAYFTAIRAGARDVITYRNLALMLGEMGQFSRAILYAEEALRVAPPNLEPDVARLLEELKRLRDSVGSGSGTPGDTGELPRAG